MYIDDDVAATYSNSVINIVSSIYLLYNTPNL